MVEKIMISKHKVREKAGKADIAITGMLSSPDGTTGLSRNTYRYRMKWGWKTEDAEELASILGVKLEDITQ